MAIKYDSKRKTWMIDIYINGKRTTRRGFKSKAEALANEAVLLGNREDQADKVSFLELYNSFMVYYLANNKPGSTQSIKYKLSKRVVPHFENVDDIGSITPHDIEEWKNQINGLSLKYCQNIFIAFSTLMSYAVDFYGIKTNPLKVVKNFSGNDIAPEKKIDYFTLSEFNKFNDALPVGQNKVLFNFLFWTGCRLGETLALNWNDFNRDFSTVKINKSMTNKVKGKKYVITKPKTTTSIRSISIPPQLQQLLLDIFDDLSKVPGFNKGLFVFGWSEPGKHTTIERIKNKACDDAGVKRIRLHDFRHSHATYLITNGADMYAVSKRLGHSSINITIDTYTHLTEKDEDKLLNLMTL